MDEHVVGPLLEAVRRKPEWRVLVAPDHPTPVTTRAHSAVPPPFCYAGTGVNAVERRPFCERAATESGLYLDPGYTLMGHFMGRA